MRYYSVQVKNVPMIAGRWRWALKVKACRCSLTKYSFYSKMFKLSTPKLMNTALTLSKA